MADDMLEIAKIQVDRLHKKVESARVERESHLQAASECEQAIARNEAKIEALEELLATANRINHEDVCREKQGGLLENGHRKMKATAAIFSLIDERGAVTREQILDLADAIDSGANDKRHILQTTVYLLTKRGKLVEDSTGRFQRPE